MWGREAEARGVEAVETPERKTALKNNPLM